MDSLFGTTGKRTLFCINAVGVEISRLGMAHEQEVLLLPGLPLVNRPGENPEPDLWTFEVETPAASVITAGSPSVMIDYVHPGWDSLFHDGSWRSFSVTEPNVVSNPDLNHKIV